MTSSQKPAEPVTTKYALEFNAQALKEWEKLDSTIRLQFAKKLKERLVNPRVEADKLRDMPNCYKIRGCAEFCVTGVRGYCCGSRSS